MNTVWSSYIQGLSTLYDSRKLRFNDRFAEQYKSLFALEPNCELKMLEIGCGPGALAEALRRWYPSAQITAIDRDSAFIQFARERESSIAFLEGDAGKLPCTDASVDVTISHTVAEHVEPDAFYGEQYRVLKPGGHCIVLTTRKTIRIPAACMEEDAFEKEIWERVCQADDTLQRYAVGRYAMNEAELPAALERYGFTQVHTGFATVMLTPDDSETPEELAMAIIESDANADLEAIDRVHRTMPQVVSASEIEEMKRKIRAKYDLRVEQYKRGQKQWDTTVSIIMVVRGIKPL